MQFGKELFPQIVVPWNQAAPYQDLHTGKEAPFITVGPFCSTDTLFLGVTGGFQLYTTEEVVRLRSTGIVRTSPAPCFPSSMLSSLASLPQIQPVPATLGLPKISTGSPKVEPDSSSRRQEDMSSWKGHKHPVSVAAGSSASLEKSDEWDRDVGHKGHEKDKAHNKNCKMSRECEQEHSHPKHKSSHCKYTSDRDCSGAVKHG